MPCSPRSPRRRRPLLLALRSRRWCTAASGSGILVALAPERPDASCRATSTLVRSYATQAAIALANARLFRAQQELATRDRLTGLLNHREFHESVERELARGRRYGERALAVVLLRPRRLQAGQRRARPRRGRPRPARRWPRRWPAPAARRDLAFRVGGDEFALLLPETDEAEAFAAAERAQKAMMSVAEVDGVSFGVTGWPADADSKDGLIAEADGRLYEMKRSRESLTRRQ